MTETVKPIRGEDTDFGVVYVIATDYARLEQECERLRAALEFIARLHIIPPYMTPQASQLILVKGHADAALSAKP